MSTWLVALICFGVVVVVAALSYVVWRWGGKKAAITSAALGVSGVVLGIVRTFLKDDPEKLDAYDFVSAGESLSKRLTDILKKHQSGVSFLDTKADMVVAVKEVLAEFPGMGDKLTDEMIEKEVEAALILVSSIPKVKDIIKK